MAKSNQRGNALGSWRVSFGVSPDKTYVYKNKPSLTLSRWSCDSVSGERLRTSGPLVCLSRHDVDTDQTFQPIKQHVLL